MDYLQTIVDVIRRSERKKSGGIASSLGLVRFNRNRFIVKRFKQIQDNTPIRRNMIYNAVLVAVCIGVFISSYMFILQSEFKSPENDEDGYIINEGSYIMLNEGIYMLYNNGEYQFTFPDEESALQMIEMLNVPLKNEGQQ